MAIGDDFSIAANGDIRETGGSVNYTVLELHRWLQDLADDQEASGNDLVDIISFTPSDRSTDQIITLVDHTAASGPVYNIDDTASQRFYDGSVSQNAGDVLYSGLQIVGTVEAGTEIQVIQDEAIFTSFWSTGINPVPAENILNQVLIKSRVDGADLDGKRILVQAREFNDSYAEFSVTLGLANSTAAIFTADDLNNNTAVATVATWDQFSNTEGYQLLDIDGDTTGEPYYSQWTISAGATPASPTGNDLYEWTKREGRRGTAATMHTLNGERFRGPTHEIDYDGEFGSGPGTENDYLVWGTKFDYDTELAGGLTVGEYYTFQTSGAVGKLLALDDDGTAGSVIFAIEPGSGTVVDTESFIRSDGTATDGADVNDASIEDGAAVGGRGVILALLDSGAAGTYWIQLISGAAPVNNLNLWATTTGGVYDDAAAEGGITNLTPVSRTISPEFFGASTGSNILGAYGIGVVPSEAVVGDSYTDLGTTVNNPPNNVTFIVGGLISGEDRVLVTNDSGSGSIDFTQLTLNTDLTGAAETTVNVTASIPTDTPFPTGTLRVEDDLGIQRYLDYTTFSGANFTITAENFTAPNDATGAKNVFITYLDLLATGATESFTYVYDADRTHFIRVRDGGTAGDAIGIKTFETTGVMSNTGGGVTAIRTPDA